MSLIKLDPRVLRLFFGAVGQLERLWDNEMEVFRDFWRKTIGCYTKQPRNWPLIKSVNDQELAGAIATTDVVITSQ